ncbi:hypothetical protein MYX76_05695 [Desulfobacterota bacterium AH_259_B03_O07]|nr:hypothetical protein [Desulfobacterota bacterium AH_259_B03_O07]
MDTLKIVIVFLSFLYVTGAKSADIKENEVEDLSLLISQVLGGQPNILIIYDNSLPTGDNFGGAQHASWDLDDTISTCNSFQNLKDSVDPSQNARYAVAHCAGNASGLNPCGRSACSASQTGTCQLQDDFERFIACIEGTYSAVLGMDLDEIFNNIFSNVCGGDIPDNCDTDAERAKAASAIENLTVATLPAAEQTCGSLNCIDPVIPDKSCNDQSLFNNFVSCMDTSLLPTNDCTDGFNCTKFKYGTTRMDAIKNTFFDILDADDSLASLVCEDPNQLFTDQKTGSCINDPDDPMAVPPSGQICCDQFMNTPFRDVGVIVRGTGGSSKLPIAGGDDIPLLDVLTSADTAEFNARIRPMTYGGGGKNDPPPGDLTGVGSCEGNPAFGQPQGGFAGGSIQSFDNIWKFMRDRRVGGRAPLANAIGFDDDNASNSSISQDALDSFRVELQTDPACSCRAEFAIVVTSGLDNCSGDCSSLNGTSGACSTDANGVPALVTGFSNMRSVLQAGSNLRTYYARNPITNNENCPEPTPKEIITFVIGLGIKDPAVVRMLNSLALGGGATTEGIVKHFNASGALIGTVDLELIPGLDPIFVDFGKATGIDTNPEGAHLKECLIPDGNGVCEFMSTPVFDNTFFSDFSTPGALDETDVGDSFAFFVDDPSELVEAIDTIFDFIGAFPTTGVAPTAAQSSASVAISDRILVGNLTPNLPERIWQGRLALFGFIDEPGNPGSKVVIRVPDPGADLTDPAVVDTHRIFNANGILNFNALQFHWEAGKNLAETDLDSDPRRMFTVQVTEASTVDEELDGAQVARVRFEGERVNFDTSLKIDEFGIGDADVTDPIPDYCKQDPLVDCSSDCLDANGDSVLPFTDDCKTCVEGCFRDRVVSFMSGNTDILPLGDPFGIPTLGAQTSDSFGFACPDPVQNQGGFETCSVRLGDVFHSRPVLVGSPPPLFFDFGFQAFASEFRDRSAAVYVGTNDGFLHAFHAGELELASADNPIENPFNLENETLPFFNAGTGRELFAFSPPSFLPDSISENGPASPSGVTPPDFRFGDFKTFVVEKNEQRSFFDGSPLVADVFIDGYTNGIAQDASLCPGGAITTPDGQIDLCGREWHTLLISGYRNGGGAVTALDVTNVKCAGGVNTDCSNIGLHKAGGNEYPRALWTLFDRDFGNTWSDVTIGRVRMLTQDAGGPLTVDRWVAFLGGGLDPLDTDPRDGVTYGDAFYAIDIATGKVIYKFNPDDPIPSSLSDPNIAKMECDMVGKAGVFDINADGYMDVAFSGDTCGRLWRFDVSMPIIDNGNDITQTELRGDADITAADWTGDIAFCATADSAQCLDPTLIAFDDVNNNCQRRPIFFAPTAVFDNLGNLHIIFVTGNRRNPSDSCQFGKLYNYIDTFIPAFLAGGTAVAPASFKTEGDFDAGQIVDLVSLAGVPDQFTTEGGSTINNQGEFIVRFPDNLDTSGDSNVESSLGEKGFGTPVVIRGVLLFTTFAPDPMAEENPCGAGLGEGRLFALDFLTGEEALVRVPGAANLLEGSDTEKEATAGKTVASGMPTPAQLTFGSRGSVVLTVAFSGGAAPGGANFLVMQLPQLATRTQTLFWEEIL